MVTGERLTLTLTGGAPWGFRLQGGGGYPLEVAKIRKGSHASEAGLREGDVVLSINGHPTSGKTHQSAMDIVEMASSSITFEVARSGKGPTMPIDPQRQPRIIPMISGPENTGPGVVTSAHANYSTTSGNTRTDVHTDQYVLNTGDGRKVTKTVTEQRVTKFPGSAGISPAVSHTSVASGEHVSRSANRSPLMWQPLSQTQGEQSARPASHSPAMWRPPSQVSGDIPRSASRSPVSWQPHSLPSDQPAQMSASWQAPGGKWRKQQNTNMQKSQSLLDVHFGHRKSSPPSSRSLSPVPRSKNGVKKSSTSKENIDPIIASEQAKWEKLHINDPPLKHQLSSFEASKLERKKYQPPKMDDPNYPMFEVPQAKWSAPRIVEPDTPSPSVPTKKFAPPVPPKPLTPSPSPLPWAPDEMPVAGLDKHYPGMIRPPHQPNVAPAPTPPPMPVFPSATAQLFNASSIAKPRSLEGFPSTHHPDHLPVFAPRVMFTPDDTDGGMLSPDRHDEDYLLHKKKVFSDSAFYDDATNRYPTIDEQMSMCKKIAQSLTSFANKRARGARMFAKRKRKADKWIHEQTFANPRRDLGGSEYSSSIGDIADIDELDSELYHDEGGNRPLFSFRIPSLRHQVSDGQKMSMSKAEFETLRLAAPKVDHHNVSPNQCFAISADLHRGGRNKGAKLFQKRQQRVEKFVIDETNVKSPVSPPTKLEYIVTHPAPAQKNPWNAAAQGDVSRAFNSHPAPLPLQPLPRHNLAAENQPKLLGGKNFNTKARGWGGAGPGHEQHSFYRDY